MTMKYDTKCPTTGNRTACNKATPPPLTQEILFARKLKKIAARRETLSTKSNKKLSYALLKSRFAYEEHMFCLTGALQKAAAVLWHLASMAPMVFAVHRDGKSLHGWFSCAGADEDTQRRFMRYAVMLGADPATWTRCQFVRMPDGRRPVEGECPVRQNIFHTVKRVADRVTTSTAGRPPYGCNADESSQPGKMVLSWSEFFKVNCGSRAICELRCAKRCAGSRSARPHPDSQGAAGSASSRRAPENQGPALDAGLSRYHYGLSVINARARHIIGAIFNGPGGPFSHCQTCRNLFINRALRNLANWWDLPGKILGKIHRVPALRNSGLAPLFLAAIGPFHPSPHPSHYGDSAKRKLKTNPK
jgi:hypothetical protein